jgi:hypothetical protein
MITGSRDFTSRAIIAKALSKVFRDNGKQPFTLVHGAARGADSIGAAIARDYPERITAEAHPAIWRTPDGELDKAAGFRRNKQMVDSGVDICLAFFHVDATNRGTKHAKGYAEKQGVPVVEYWQDADGNDVTPEPATGMAAFLP